MDGAASRSSSCRCSVNKYWFWIRMLLTGNERLFAAVAGLLLCFPIITYYKFALTKSLFDKLSSEPSVAPILLLAGLLFILQLVEEQVERTNQYCNERMNLRVNYKLDNFLLHRIQPTTITNLESPRYRNDLNIVMSSLSNLSLILTSLITLAHQMVLIGMYAHLLFRYGWWFVLITVIFSIPGIYYTIARLKREDAHYREFSQVSIKTNTLSGLLTHPYVLKELIVFAAKPMLLSRWLTAAKERITGRVRFLNKEFRLSFLFSICSPSGQFAVQVLLLYRLSRSDITLGDYVAIMSAAAMLGAALKNFWTNLDVIKKIQLFSGHYSSFERNYLQQPSSQPAIVADDISHFSCRGVHFAYPDQPREVLRGVDVDIVAGESIAFVGENGSGKSTLAKVLFGFHDLPRGSLFLNRLDINDYDREALFSHIAIVNQDYIKYPLSVYENIAMNDCGEEDKRMVDDFLRRYPSLVPDNLDCETVIGNDYLDSVQLSGGQWQRIAIARALYKNAPILIFDEATSEVDPETEKTIIDGVLKERKDKMTLLITHSLYISAKVDRIYVLDEGNVVEAGHHEELLAKRGKYYAMWMAQVEGDKAYAS